ncbi:arabinogalactan endo-beta-1,4-galactanase, partial [bacterium]
VSMIIHAQTFYFGNDLSYVNQMEDCGAIFKENGEPKDVYQIFADHGCNLVRVRLWVDPSWWQSPINQPEGVKSFYNDFEDVKETILRSKTAGMQVLLDFHYSDFWADPGRQLIPQRWMDVADDLDALKDSVYQYTTAVLTKLNKAGLMPEMVQVGNETNGGMLSQISEAGKFEPAKRISNDWTRHAELFNTAIQAVRNVGKTASVNPKIVIHFADRLSRQAGHFQNVIDHGVTDFDIMGISYYVAWHRGNIQLLESTMRDLLKTFPGFEMMVVETGYPWSTENFDSLMNIVTVPDSAYLPVIPEKQLEYLVDYTRAVMRGGGSGVIFWEPAWVSTPCRTPWGQGSSHDHLAFFDPVETNFINNGGGRWSEAHFYKDIHFPKVTFKIDMTNIDVSKGVYIAGTFSEEPWELIPMTDLGNQKYGYFTYLPEGYTGGFYFLNDRGLQAREILSPDCMTWEGKARAFEVTGGNMMLEYSWEICVPVNGTN